MFAIILLVCSIFAGFLGALLGLGGGIIVVPVLTLGFGVDIKYAIAASLISIIATSSGAAASFLKDHLTNLRVAVLLEAGTVSGALIGFTVASYANSQMLYLLYGSFLIFSAILMLKKRGDSLSVVNHPWATKLKLEGRFENHDKTMVNYKVANVPAGLVAMFFAGTLSAMLGIGSGIFKVLAMDGAMKLPLKVSSATSNFMIGVTASASAGAYLLRGDVRPEIAAPVSLGIIVGSWVGARVMPRINASTIKKIFVGVLLVVAVQMLMKGLQ
jgi:uncharacterized protein